MWYDGGNSILFKIDPEKNLSEDEVLNMAAQYIEDYFNGYIHCSDCQKAFPKTETDGYKRSYFAGKYCQRCWDIKWKDIEAKEIYN